MVAKVLLGGYLQAQFKDLYYFLAPWIVFQCKSKRTVKYKLSFISVHAARWELMYSRVTQWS